MLLLVAVGIAVAVFGALVLLRFPDRPGGKIAWQDFEVSSVGAGLPLIALGVGLVTFAGFRGENDRQEAPAAPATAASPTLVGTAASPSETAAVGGACTESFVADIPPERRETLGVGILNRKAIGGAEQLEGPIGLVLEDRGAAVGAVRLTYDPAGAPFYLDGIVDAACRDLPAESHESMSGDIDGDDTTWIQYDEVCIDFGPRNYLLRLDAGGDIRLSFRRSGCSPS